MRVFIYLLSALALVAAGMALWRWSDLRRDRAEMARLWSGAVTEGRFDPAMVADLPEPVQRYFLAAIRPGTPLYRASRIEMAGTFDLGNRDAPKPLGMAARQVLAGPDGFVWQARLDSGISGSDSGSWTRFWLMGLVPVARAGGDADHARSAFGRAVIEAAVWLPTSVLPQPGITWEAPDEHRVRVTVTRDGMTQSVDLTLDAAGHAVEAVLPRWSNANPDKAYQVQPFGGRLWDHRDFGGLVVPAQAEVGNFYGTPEYHPFFMSTITDMTFPHTKG
jgi:hypothetical protein